MRSYHWFILLASTAPSLCLAASSVDLFPYEKITLKPSDDVTEKYPKILKFGHLNRTKACRAAPGDENWPSDDTWNTISELVEGRLVSPPPIASPCYQGSNYDESECARIVTQWNDSVIHAEHPSSIINPLFSGLSCLPTSNPNDGNCTQGTYPVKVIDVKTVSDVQVGVLAAKNLNLRLVIKNTGHDYLGRSAGKDGLSIRTHALKDFVFLKDYRSEFYQGPAVKVGAGIQGEELNSQTNALGYLVVGGSSDTIGYAGGYMQGGGHPLLATIYGMAADQVLEINVVTADGNFITASQSENSDLYWAMRGGGGSTYGVLVSVVVKAYPTQKTAVSRFKFGASAADLERAAAGDRSWRDFWSVMEKYLSLFPEYADKGIWANWRISTARDDAKLEFSMESLVAFNKTGEEVDALLQPVVDQGAAVGISISPNGTSHENYFEAWKHAYPREAVGQWNFHVGSRFIPREHFEDQAKFNETVDVIRTMINEEQVFLLIGFITAPKLYSGNAESSVHPAWRKNLFFTIPYQNWDDSIRDFATIRNIRAEFRNVTMQPLRDTAPETGGYVNESDFAEPNWQTTFWGENYPRLVEIKRKYDPDQVFYAVSSPGSEGWTTGIDTLGRLCPV